jgi:Nuclease-related domain
VVRNRPAHYQRGRLAAAWRIAARRFWRELGLVVVVVIAYIGLVVVLPGPAWWLGFCAGALVGALVVLALSATLIYAGEPEKIYGVLGEQATAEVLQSRRMRRDGWHVVHGLPFAGHGDVDHVLVGPGGVYAIESKWTNRDWTVVPRSPRLADALAQARLSARRIESTARVHHLGHVKVHPVVMWWGKGAPAICGGHAMIDDVIVVDGHQADQWVSGPRTDYLDPSAVDAVADALRFELDRRREPMSPPRTEQRTAERWYR